VGVTLEQLRHCLSVLISARQDVDGSPEGSICVAICRTEIGCRSAACKCKWRSLNPGEKPPTDKALNRWMNQFKETGTVEKQKSTGRPISLVLFKL